MSTALHIIVQFIRFKGGIVKPKDDIRLSLTSLPAHGKDHICKTADKLANINHEFVINVDAKTEYLLLIVRRKSYINGDPILGGIKLSIQKIPRDKPLEQVFNIDEVLTVNTGNTIHKSCGTIGIKAFFIDDINTIPPLTPETSNEPKAHFAPPPSFAQNPPSSGNIRPQNSAVMPQLQPHHKRRKSLMPKWKKNSNSEYAGFDDDNMTQPLTNSRCDDSFQKPM